MIVGFSRMRSRVFALVGVWCAAMAAVGGHSGLLASQQASPPRPADAPASPRPAPLQPVSSRAAAPAAAVQPEALVKQVPASPATTSGSRPAGLALDGAELSNIPADRGDLGEGDPQGARPAMMPPAGMPRPAQAALDRPRRPPGIVDRQGGRGAPRAARAGASIASTASEYGNAIRDLFALDVDVAALLPPDEEAYGFDNNADVLGVSPSLMERYLSAAWKIGGLAVASPKITPSLETFRVRGDLSQHDHVEGLPIGTRGGILITHYFPVDGEYVISPRLYRETVNIIRGLELPHDLEVAIDGERVRAGARSAARRTSRRTTCTRRSPATRWRSASKCACPSRRACTPSGVAFIKKSSRHHAGAAAAVRARAHRSDYAGRHPRAGQGHAGGAVQRRRRSRRPRPAAAGSSSASPPAGQDAACAVEDPDRRWRAAPIAAR